MTDLAALRAEFPVLARVAYLNTGTQGPVPRRGAEAAARAVEDELERGRGDRRHFMAILALCDALRERVAALLGCRPGEVALTRSTTDGVNTVLSSLELGPGDEVLTSDEEHPGVLAPLAAARRRRGFEVREAPFAEVAAAAGPRTRLVACSHVSWVSGRVVDATALAAVEAPVLLDGAQGLGAVPTDVETLGCDFYAASGQKWLCGPDATGYLYVRPERMGQLAPPWPSYVSLAEPADPSALRFHPGANRFDMGIVPRAQAAWALAALDVLAAAGWDRVLERGPALADRLAGLLAERGLRVLPRGRSTLVAWADEASSAAVERLAGEGLMVRELPGRGLLRASAGAWSSEEELERLAALAAAS